MTLRVGIVGPGDVATSYVASSRAFTSYDVVACAGRDARRTQAFATRNGLVAMRIDELLASDVDVVLNLTPVEVHAAITSAALAAGKHVYSEKPLAATVEDGARLVAEARSAGLRLACAPDVVLGPPYRRARELLAADAVGDPLAIKAAFLEGGPEERHPNPDIFYGPHSGPLLDMGPYYLAAIVALFGSVRRVAGIASTRRPRRTVAVGPRAGETFTTRVPTHVAALLELDGGTAADLVTSYEAPGRYVAALVVHGTRATMTLPDPNWHGGAIRIDEDVVEVVSASSDFRGPGLDDLARSIAEGRPHLASAELALHVLDVASSVLRAAQEGRVLDVATRFDPPQPPA